MDQSSSQPPILDRFSPENVPTVNGVTTNGVRHSNGARQSTSAPNVVTTELYNVPGVRHKANFRVLSQQVHISEFSFADRSFRIHTKLVLLPSDNNAMNVCLHMGQAVLINEEANSVTIDGLIARHRRRDPIGNVIGPNLPHCIAELEPKIYMQVKENDYNLDITVPEVLKDKIKHRRAIRISIDATVVKPTKGLTFVEASKDQEFNNDEHVYTYHTPYISGTREWLPCYDEPDQLSLWDIKFELPMEYVPVVSAELKDKVYSETEKDVLVYTFTQTIPTSACNIGWAIGKFQPDAHKETPTIHTFSLPGLRPFVKHTTMFVDKMIEFLEEKLSCRMAYPTLKIVFVDQASDDINVYSSLLIASTSLLYHRKVIDVVQEVRQKLINGIAQQFFGSFISPSHWIHWWIVKSISRLMTSLYVETKLGMAEARWQLKRMMDDVCDYEHQWGKVVLSPNISDQPRLNLHFDPRHEYTCSPLYVETMIKKGYLTMRMLLKRLGQEPFLRVLHRLLTVGLEMSEKKTTPGAWKHLLTCTEAFFRAVSTVTGSEIPTFVEQWLQSGGHAAFAVKFDFNRKRNMIELEVKQDDSEGNGRVQYTGPLSIVVQEVDGAFTQTIQIDGAISHADVQCHSKGRKQKRKKIPIMTGEEIEFDLSNMDAESPVLWIRLDYDYLLIREINISQPMFHWEYMLKYERDVIAQMEALERIQTFPSAQSKSIIVDAIANEKFFYRIRCRAAFVLSSVQNRKSEALAGGTPVLVNMFKEMYGSKAVPHIPKPNNFVVTSQYLQQYFIMQALPQAAAKLRKHSGECYEDVLKFLLDLVRFNDNSTNRYSDDYYTAALLSALGSCIYPAECLPMRVEIPENLTIEVRKILKELTYALNMDTVNPSYGRVVGIAALSGLYQLQKCGYLPLDSRLLWMFSEPKICVEMRKASVNLIVDRICNDPNASDCRLRDCFKLLEMAKNDIDPSIRKSIPRLLAETPPFATYNNTEYGHTNSCNTDQFADKLWEFVTDRKIDSNVRCSFVDLYFSLFGLGVPPSCGGPAEAAGHHRSYVTVASASSNLATSQWHNSAYEAARRSPPRVSNFGDDSLM